MMVDILIENGIVVTMDEDRSILDPGSVAIRDKKIEAVGKKERIASEYGAEKTIDASQHVVLPGFIDTHIHVPDILSRGIGKERKLYDWLVNFKKPFVAAMEISDHAVASVLYCHEAIRFGVTTFVENAGGTGSGYDLDVIKTKLAEYDTAGIRNIYADGFMDKTSGDEIEAMLDNLRKKEPQINHPKDGFASTNDALDRIESLIEEFHGTADGRQSIWPAPYTAVNVTPEGLRGAYDLAEKYDVMTTTHTAESELQERSPLSNVEYLRNASYLGDRTLLGHCVQLDQHDIRLLAETDTKVAHNIATNLVNGSGIAPVPEMLNSGVTVSLGTDNACLNDTINPLSDMRLVDLVHKGSTRNPCAITPETVLEMATTEAAKAIGRKEDLGSIKPGKMADLILLDLDHSHLTPHTGIVETLVYQAQGTEIDTVICNGKVIMEDKTVLEIEHEYPELVEDANNRADSIANRAGLSSMM
jgi:cytosine/adenosine deaminase-related metal-dependent hydrolase